ncbi:hypothetical protein Hanom_Chr16g01470961 [Helianthus anomalus]
MIGFPALLKKRTLDGCHLPWSRMSYIQSLPNLEVQKLLTDAFVGPSGTLRIPFDMTYIPTLEDIQNEGCSNSVIVSTYEIQEEQHVDGNYDIKIRVESTRSTNLIQLHRALGSFMKLNQLMNDTHGSEMRSEQAYQ